MLDIGWPELLIVALVTIIVVGPKELPRVLRTVTQMVRKLRAMASEFQSGIDELAREAELDELKKDIERTAATDIAGELENEIDPDREVAKSMREIETSLKEDPRKSADAGESSRKREEGAAASSPPTDEPEAIEHDGDASAAGKKSAGGSA
jgi:sec-independent protein translocase protein TatB